MADGTLSLNSRELEDGEVVDITELAPEGHGITQGVKASWAPTTFHLA
jgi:hypothetical protein